MKKINLTSKVNEYNQESTDLKNHFGFLMKKSLNKNELIINYCGNHKIKIRRIQTLANRKNNSANLILIYIFICLYIIIVVVVLVVKLDQKVLYFI